MNKNLYHQGLDISTLDAKNIFLIKKKKKEEKSLFPNS